MRFSSDSGEVNWCSLEVEKKRIQGVQLLSVSKDWPNIKEML
jgi:hypothetical protein